MRLCLWILAIDVFQKNYLQQIHFPQKAHCFVLDCIYRDDFFLNLSNNFALDFRISELGIKMKKLCTALLLSLFAISFAHANETKQIVLKVKEMNCQLCAYLVNKELRNIDGVISTKASIKDGLVTVMEDPKVTNQQLFDAIHKLEYTAEVVK